MEGVAWRSDAELVEGVRRGEDFAFGQLFERWFERVMEVAVGILGDPQAAAEVATDTFQALWHHLDQLGDAEAFGAWSLETSRTFATERRAHHPPDSDRERTSPIPVASNLSDLSAVVSGALLARGLPAGALHGGTAGAMGPMGLAHAAPHMGGAANAGSAGFAGAPGTGTILADAAPTGVRAGQALNQVGGGVSLALADDDSYPNRIHRYEPPSPDGGPLVPVQVLVGAGIAVLVVVAGCLLYLITRGGDGTDLDASSATTGPAAPTISAPAPIGAGGAGLAATSSTVGSTSSPLDPATTTVAAETSTTRRATSTTKATTSTSAGGTASTTATTTSTTPTTASTASTTASTTPTTPSSVPTTPSSVPTTPSSDTTTPTRPVTTPTTTPTTAPLPVIDTFTGTGAAGVACSVTENGYVVTWAVSNATAASVTGSVLTTPAQAFGSKLKGSFQFCAPKGTGVTLNVSGPGGKASKRLVL